MAGNGSYIVRLSVRDLHGPTGMRRQHTILLIYTKKNKKQTPHEKVKAATLADIISPTHLDLDLL